MVPSGHLRECIRFDIRQSIGILWWVCHSFLQYRQRYWFTVDGYARIRNIEHIYGFVFLQVLNLYKKVNSCLEERDTNRQVHMMQQKCDQSSVQVSARENRSQVLRICRQVDFPRSC